MRRCGRAAETFWAERCETSRNTIQLLDPQLLSHRSAVSSRIEREAREKGVSPSSSAGPPSHELSHELPHLARQSLLSSSSPTTNKKVQKKGEVKKKVVSALPRKAASRGRLPAVKYRHGQVPSVASASQKQGK